MNDAQIDDLKSFFRTEMRMIAVEVMQELRSEMNAGFVSIADIITGHNDQLDNHEGRIGRLEQRSA